MTARPDALAVPMTAKRAQFFLRRFKNDEKMLGPYEQQALDFTIAALEASPGCVVVPVDPTEEIIYAIRWGISPEDVWQKALAAAAPKASAPVELDHTNPVWKDGFDLGRAESEMLCGLIRDPKCDTCGARNATEAETMCRPSGDSCLGSEWPLEQLWSLATPQADPAPPVDPAAYLREADRRVGEQFMAAQQASAARIIAEQRAEAMAGRLRELHAWFEQQARAIGKGCGSPFELMQVREQRDSIDALLRDWLAGQEGAG